MAKSASSTPPDGAVNIATEPAAAPPSFEGALAELEKLVAKLESGSLTLEQSLTSHRRGLELAKFCQDLLAHAEQQVDVLEGEVLHPLPSGGDLAADND